MFRENHHSDKDRKRLQDTSDSINCDKDPVASLKTLFVDIFQGGGLRRGRDPATRPVFLRMHGAAYGRFVIQPDLPDDLAVGVFGQKPEYPVWVRSSSDVQPGRPDLKGTIGIALKLFGVDGEKLLSPDESAVTQDFILQNHDVFFVDTAKDMCEFTQMSLDGKADEYIAGHPITGEVLSDMEKVVDSVLDTNYWSVLPYRFGDRYVKYKIEPEVVPPGEGSPPDYNDPFYLKADLLARLKRGEVRLRFLVQFRTNDKTMPLDAATVRWSEEESEPVHVATLILPQQDLNTREQTTYGENLAFNPWHSLSEHEPVGSISDARKVVYQASANVRRNFNGVPLAEPEEPRPAEWKPGTPYPPGKDTRVVRAAIHPAIGVARVGDSPIDWFYGPEVPNPKPPEGGYRDDSGALKREACRFRIYGYNAAGEVVHELTADRADISWTAHVANRKAAWYQWEIALDIPQAEGTDLALRNAEIRERKQLVIDGGAQTISGKSAPAKEFRDTFMEQVLRQQRADPPTVYLGELRTDEAGRLVFFAGHGVSASPTGSPIFDTSKPNSFINADGWYDDVCDGPVTAEVNIAGRPIPVEPAWVVTAPPNYAPAVIGVRTLYDELYNLFVANRWLAESEAPVSFRNDVYPILHRLSNLQWVNQGFAIQFGRGGPHDFDDPAYIAKLAEVPGPYDVYVELRQQILNSFRLPKPEDGNQLPWPWVYGDAMMIPAANIPQQNASIAEFQYRVLQRWAAGDFINDWEPAPELPSTIEDVDVADQPQTLDRSALQFCLADAFHPGCELTWPIRHLSMYSKPFRIRHRPADQPEPSYGRTLTPAEALASNGPLNAQGPGDLTRWMGLPWQADTAFCRSGYDDQYDPYVPTFWPARVPNQVLTKAAYDIIRNENFSREYRLALYNNRMEWVEPLTGSTAGQMEDMVRIFGSMGLLKEVEGLENDPDFPPKMYIATFGPAIPEPGVPFEEAARPEAEAAARVEAEGVPAPKSAKRKGWGTTEERSKAPLPVRHPRKP